MSTRSVPLAGPISQDWTVRHLLETLADDIDAISLDELLDIEAGLLERSAAGPAPWTARPHPIAVIRSIATLTRLDRSAALLTIGELLPRAAAVDHPFSSKPPALTSPKRVDSTRRGGFDDPTPAGGDTSTPTASTREKQLARAS